jgi:peptidoglycan/xylan/chitin deacetylase (PgdA/CDA1 family)
LLKKYGLTATFFITVGFIEKNPQILDYFKYLLKCNYREIIPLSWNQIKEMYQEGMEIGSHTYSHFHLIHLDQKRIKWELEQSKKILEDQLGEVITLLSYPFGYFNSLVVMIAKEVGYHYGASTIHRGVCKNDNPLILPRFYANYDTIEILAQKIYGVRDWEGWLQEKIPLWLTHIIRF